MITIEDIENYIKTIPPLPEKLRGTFLALQSGDLMKAAKYAQEDKALSYYLKNIVNKPYFGFATIPKEMTQIFSAFGLNMAEQVIKAYMISLICPKDWVIFNISTPQFENLQAEIMANWSKILEAKKYSQKEIYAAATLLPATIIICEKLFKEKKKDVEMLRDVKRLDYNTIIKKLSGKGFFEIAGIIGEKWEMSSRAINIVLYSQGNVAIKDIKSSEEDIEIARFLHMLFFKILSEKQYMQSGLNDFVNFDIDFVQPIYYDFVEIMGLAE